MVVVCSARSGDSKATGTTNLLLRAAIEATRPSPSAATSAAPSVPPTPSINSADKLNPLTSQIFNRPYAVPRNGNGSASGTSTPSLSLSGSVSNLRIGGAGGNEDASLVFCDTVDQIKEDHLAAARTVIKNEDILAELCEELEYDCERLRSFLLAVQARPFPASMLKSRTNTFAIDHR